MEFDESELKDTEDRLNTVNHLKAKYGNSIWDVLEHQKECEKIIDRLTNYELYKDELKKREQKLYKDLTELCKKVSEIRKEKALILEEEIKRVCETKPFSKMDCLNKASVFDENDRLKEYIVLYKEINDDKI